MDKIERKWYNCVGVGWEIRRRVADLFVYLILGINEIGNGIQRNNQREKGHIKDLYCLQCQDTTKNLEIRYCDSFDEMMQKAEELHREYYQ